MGGPLSEGRNVELATSLFEQTASSDHVAVIEYVSSSPHFETSLEIALQLAEAGVKVSYFYIGHTLDFVDFRRNFFGLTQRIIRKFDLRPKSGRRIRPLLRRVAKLARDIHGGSSFQFVRKIDDYRAALNVDERYLDSCQHLVEYRYGKLPFGVGLANSLSVSVGSIYAVPLEHSHLLNQILESQMRVYNWCSDLFRRGDFSHAVLFNGRFAASQAIQIAAESYGIQVWRHERGGADGKGFQVVPFPTHSLPDVGDWVSKRWVSDPTDMIEKERVARRFFSADQRGRDLEGRPFIESPKSSVKPGRAQGGTQAREQIVTFFTSTEGEYELLGRDQGQGVFASQRAAAEFLAIIAEEEKFNLRIRVHPNASRGTRSELDWWENFLEKLKGSNTMLFEANSPVDSYELLAESDLVIAWQSTIALEATYMGVPAVCLGEVPYRQAGAEIFLPASTDELLHLIQNPPKVTQRDSVLPYAYALQTSQEVFRWYEPLAAWKGKILGLRVR